MRQPTQTNLKLQLELGKLVLSKNLPIWDFTSYMTRQEGHILAKYPLIDFNNNRFGEWLDKVFPKETDPLSWKSYYAEDDCEVIATTAEYFKVIIGCSGLTDTILKEIIQEIKLKPIKPNEPSK